MDTRKQFEIEQDKIFQDCLWTSLHEVNEPWFYHHLNLIFNRVEIIEAINCSHHSPQVLRRTASWQWSVCKDSFSLYACTLRHRGLHEDEIHLSYCIPSCRRGCMPSWHTPREDSRVRLIVVEFKRFLADQWALIIELSRHHRSINNFCRY